MVNYIEDLRKAIDIFEKGVKGELSKLNWAQNRTEQLTKERIELEKKINALQASEEEIRKKSVQLEMVAEAKMKGAVEQVKKAEEELEKIKKAGQMIMEEAMKTKVEAEREKRTALGLRQEFENKLGQLKAVVG